MFVDALLFTILVFAVSFITTFISNRILHPEVLKQYLEEVKSFEEALKEAKKSGDKKALRNLEKKAVYIQQLRNKVSSANMKRMFISMGILLSFFWFVIPLFMTKPIIRYPPYTIYLLTDTEGYMPIIWWYFIVFMWAQSIWNRVFKYRYGG